jgi:hypothetical protein
MATAAEKMEALAYWAGGSILCATMALMGTPIWGTIYGVLNALNMTGDFTRSNLHAVQPIPMMYYGFLVAFEIALIIRTVFVVWSKTTYETSY